MKVLGRSKLTKLTAILLVMVAVMVCSFQCSDVTGFSIPADKQLKLELLKKKDIPVWTVYPLSENLPETNIFFAVRNMSKKTRVWAECPEGDLEVKVFPVCSRFTLSVSPKEGYSGFSHVILKAKSGDQEDELEIIVEYGRILLGSNELSLPPSIGTYEISIDSNMNSYATSYEDWMDVSVDGDKLIINVSKNASGTIREGKIVVHDIYEVIKSDIYVRQEM